MMIKIADLFAGIGGIRLGFEEAFGKNDVDCVFASEINKSATITYIANFGDENIRGDIRRISSIDIPSHDILLAGFPCQSFSIAGLQRGFEDKRGETFFEIERILRDKRPQAFLLENVPNLKSMNNGTVFKRIISSLEDIGYKVWHSILSGKDFGVPQNRNRLYIVGFLDKSIEFEFPKPLNIETKVGDILENDVGDFYVLSDKRWDYFQRRNARKDIGGFGRYNIFNAESPYTVTLIASYASHCEKILIRRNVGNPRKLTERECARLQGFPDDFIIEQVSVAQRYKQLGNSVCIPVIKAISEEIKHALKV